MSSERRPRACCDAEPTRAHARARAAPPLRAGKKIKAFFPGSPCEGDHSGVTEERVNEAAGVEGFDVFGGFTETDELDGDLQLRLDGNDDAPLGGAVELREED